MATDDQAEVERTALDLFEHAEVRAARERARALLLADPVARTFDGRLGLERALDQWAMALCMREANGDPARPKVSWNVDNAPRYWFGHVYPGAAVAVDNPDNINREIPIDGDGRYEIDIQLSDRPASLSLVIEEEPEHHVGVELNVASLPWLSLCPDAQGRLTVTIDADPKGDRPHHMQTKPGRLQFYARDSMADWTMIPASIRVRRLDQPGTAERSPKTVATAVAAAMVPWVDFWRGFKDVFLGYPEPNRLTGPRGRIGGWGYLAGGRFKLAEGEALIVTSWDEHAAYTGFQITDPWTIAPDPAHRQPSLNSSQITPNADGSVTYVISATDPGVANWIDTCGLSEGWMLRRWQGVPPDADPATMIREVRVVSLADLPEGLPRIDLDGRRKAIAARARSHRARTRFGRTGDAA